MKCLFTLYFNCNQSENKLWESIYEKEGKSKREKRKSKREKSMESNRFVKVPHLSCAY